MRIAPLKSFLGVLAAVAAAGSLAGASTAGVRVPTGLHGFLLTAKDAPTTTFHRTPSFAWTPVSGAMRYELQLSMSETFRDSGIIYDVSNFQTPVASINLTLPWITGSPHSLYARVRAYLSGGQVSPWSADYGFDVVPPSVPTPMSSYPGLLRWTPVEGALGYQVWLGGTGKIESANTNVLDEREYYAFHNSPEWIANVYWRVRAVRMDEINRKNGLPVSNFGPWSPIYTSSNPAPTTGAIVLGGTASNVLSDGGPTAPAHSLTPAFVWSGDETLDGQAEQFFRVEVFTDSSCLNRVFAGSIVATPAYAPRRYGGLDMPMSSDTEAAASDKFLADIPELGPVSPTGDVTIDGDLITPNEDMKATPTTSIGSGPDLKIIRGEFGSPIDLWDVEWPSSGYYWTVLPVELVRWPDLSWHWQDVELAQDVCAAGRVARFGISSHLSLTEDHTAFASGLSSTGRLVSGTKANTYYGQPLVAWTPARAADAYEVQWARNAYPFATRGKRLTWDTSYVLPLKPGTWYYRVRGYDFNMPSGAQQMGWSRPVKIVVAAPKFRIVSG